MWTLSPATRSCPPSWQTGLNVTSRGSSWPVVVQPSTETVRLTLSAWRQKPLTQEQSCFRVRVQLCKMDGATLSARWFPRDHPQKEVKATGQTGTRGLRCAGMALLLTTLHQCLEPWPSATHNLVTLETRVTWSWHGRDFLMAGYTERHLVAIFWTTLLHLVSRHFLCTCGTLCLQVKGLGIDLFLIVNLCIHKHAYIKWRSTVDGNIKPPFLRSEYQFGCSEKKSAVVNDFLDSFIQPHFFQVLRHKMWVDSDSDLRTETMR